ncbi:MAG: nucleotide pyrophosphohydrolase [Patescibacteria group bacterium]|nr:nucleotide pyrophosphohydrolase [Patescibacteria group bacterium]
MVKAVEKSSDFDELRSKIAAFVRARDWDQFHSPKNLSSAVQIEAAEIAELFLWDSDEQSYNVAKQKKPLLEEEIADVFIYLILLSEKVGCNPIQSALNKLNKNEIKYPVHLARGNNKKYNAFLD